MASVETLAIAKALDSHSVLRPSNSCGTNVNKLDEWDFGRCVFPSLPHLLRAAEQVIISKHSSIDAKSLRLAKRGLSSHVLSTCPCGPWMIGHLVKSLQGAGYVSQCVSPTICSCIDVEVATSKRSKQVVAMESKTFRTPAVQSVLRISRQPSRECLTRGSSSSLSDSPSQSLVPVETNAGHTLDHNEVVPHVGFRKLKRDDALQMALWAFDNQDRQQLETLVSALVSERDQTHKSRDYFRRRLQTIRKEVEDMKTNEKQLKFGIVQYSKRRKLGAKRFRLTVHGGYKLALSRNLGHGGGEATLQTLDSESSRQTCSAWEHLFSSSILASHADFHAGACREIDQLVADMEDLLPKCWEFQGFSGDATNSNLVQNSKVHTCVVRSAYVLPTQQGPEGDWDQFKVLTKQCLTDIQLLPETVTSNVINKMYQKQLRSRLDVTVTKKEDVGWLSLVKLNVLFFPDYQEIIYIWFG